MAQNTFTGTPLDGGKQRGDISRMFAGAARNYDLLNTLISGGRHHAWRRKVVSVSGARAGDRILDLCCGTGDFMLAFASAAGPDGLICGADFCGEMLEIGRRKIAGRRGAMFMVRADALELPFPDNSFDIVSIGFGIRNVESVERCLREMRRTLAPGGRAVILEGGRPGNPLIAVGFDLTSRCLMPLLGKLLSDEPGAYRYLPESIRRFPAGEKFVDLMEAAGFSRTSFTSLGLGTIYIYTGIA